MRPIDAAILRAIHEVRGAADDLRRLSRSVIDRAEAVHERVDYLLAREDLTQFACLNELGELQGTGRDFERMCAIVPQKQAFLAALLTIRDAGDED